jgi:hypothetical protein
MMFSAMGDYEIYPSLYAWMPPAFLLYTLVEIWGTFWMLFRSKFSDFLNIHLVAQRGIPVSIRWPLITILTVIITLYVFQGYFVTVDSDLASIEIM